VMNKLVRKILESKDCFKHIELGADLTEETRLRNTSWN